LKALNKEKKVKENILIDFRITKSKKLRRKIIEAEK
jgi:hypothetical protein